MFNIKILFFVAVYLAVTSAFYSSYTTRSRVIIAGRVQILRHRAAKDYFTIEDMANYAKLSGIQLKCQEVGPALKIEAFPLTSTEQPLGYLTAFIRPFPFGLFQLETIQVLYDPLSISCQTLII